MRHNTGHFLELGGRDATMTTIRQLSYPLSLSLITEQNGSHDSQAFLFGALADR